MPKQETLLTFFNKKRRVSESVEDPNRHACIANIENLDKICAKNEISEQEQEQSSSSHSNSSLHKLLETQEHVYKYHHRWESKYNWLYFDPVRGGGFCKYCEKHLINDQEALQKTRGVFISVPFTNYRKATGSTGKLEKHARSDKHNQALSMEETRLQGLNAPIHSLIIQQSESEKIINRQALSKLIQCVYFLAKEEIPHTTKYEPLARRIVMKNNETIDSWVKSQSERSSYISKATASELLTCISEVLDKQDEIILCNRHFSLMADESTNINNESELAIFVRYVSDSPSFEVKERFVCIVSLQRTDAESIFQAIDSELKKRNLCYDKIVSCSFDGAANFSGNVTGVRARLSKEKGYEIPYVHCRAHVLSLAVTNCRNKFPVIKRTLYVIKDIFKLFHSSPKREYVLHEVQAALEEPVLKIPEATDIRWLSTYRTVHAIFQCYKAIMITCEHIHKDGADLASSAGGILLEMANSSFIVGLVVLHEALHAVSNLSKVLQKETLKISTLPCIISGTLDHLEAISTDCANANEENSIQRKIKQIEGDVLELRGKYTNESKLQDLKCATGFVKKMVHEMEERFNDGCNKFIQLSSYFERFEQINENQCKELCAIFGIKDIDGVLADISSFKYVAHKIKDASHTHSNVLSYALQASIGYDNLKILAELLLCVPVSTASVERSFSTMNRIKTKLRNRMGQETLHACLKISMEGPELPETLIDEVINMYATKKT